MIERPAARPYDDPDLKDLVGALPRLFCAQDQPACELRAGEAVRCVAREHPCWRAEIAEVAAPEDAVNSDLELD
jgi:hypothetical protein